MIKRSKNGEGKGQLKSFSPAEGILLTAAVLFSAAVKYGIQSFFPPSESAFERLVFSLVFHGSAFLLPGLVLLFVFGCRKASIKDLSVRNDSVLPFLTALSAPFFIGMMSELFDNAGSTAEMYSDGLTDLILLLLSSVLLPGVCEEFFYRGALTRSITSFAGKAWGVIIPALIFGAGHLSSGIGIQALFTGVFYGILSDGGRRWKMCALCHMINNGCAFLASFALSENLTVLARLTDISGYILGAVFILCCILFILRRKKKIV